MKALLRRALNRWPLLKRAVLTVRAWVFPRVAVSSHYVALSGEGAQDEAQRLRASWQDEQLPARQRELVERELRLYRSGGAVDVFDVLVKALRELPDLTPGSSILEVGCSSGFYSEVLSIAQLPLAYEGCDYSAAFIEMARRSYPSLKFEQQDATQLQYPEDGFDVVVSGCCLLHIPEYAVAVQETARVARHYAVFHRTPVVWGQPEQWYRKQALTDFSRRLEILAAKLGVPTPALFLSNARSRWGSCNSRQEIRLNWRLLQAPPHIINYVVAHELAHLKEMNHSAKFWAMVEKIYPDYKTAEKELKVWSAKLHQI